MKIILTGLILVLLANPVFSKEFVFVKKVNPDKLQAELLAAGFKVSYITVTGEDKGVIAMDNSETKNPQSIIDAHVYIDLVAKLEINRVRMIVLAKKWIAGTITAAEKDELIKRFIISSLILEELE